MKNVFFKPDTLLKLAIGVLLLPVSASAARPQLEPVRSTQAAAAQQIQSDLAEEDQSPSSDNDFMVSIDDASQELMNSMKALRVQQLYKSAVTSINAGDMPEAKSRLDKLIDNPAITKEERAVLYQQRGLANIALEDFKAGEADLDAAIASLEAIKTLTPGKKFSLSNSHYGKGVICYNNGQLEAAVKEFDAALAIRPINYIHIMKCSTLIDLGRFDEAAKAYERGLTFSPKFKKEAKAVCKALKKNGKGPANCD